MRSAIGSVSPFERLRGLASRTGDLGARCELCGERLGVVHDHLLNPQSRKVLCACQACSLLFPPSANAKYKRVPRRATRLVGFNITDAEWDELAVPIGMAFFCKTEGGDDVSAVYPSPAGPVESLLRLEAWSAIAARSKAIRTMEPEVEAVLANRSSGDYFIAPLDECYRLTGLIRARWRGLSGGSEVWTEIRSFFEELRNRATPETLDA